MPPAQESKSFRFDVAFSFAGSNRPRIERIATLVREKLGDGRVFYDDWFRRDIGSGELDLNLQRVYGKEAHLIVVALSKKYRDRPWTRMEWETIRDIRQHTNELTHPSHRFRFMYLRFDNGTVPGFSRLRRYDDARKLTDEKIADEILEQLRLLGEACRSEESRDKRSRKKKTSGDAVPSGSLATPVPRSPSLQVSKSPPILFFHPATNDDRYSRREKELKWLDDCARDTGIRIATVTGQGGLGKTSLVGHWIEKHHGWQQRAFRGVFFYSFYSNRDPKDFFEAFLKFVCDVEKIPALPKDTPLHHLAATACRRWSYLVVLDGLEVLQHGEDDPHYGWIADGELTEFVARVGAEGASLLVLTSRFPFPRITDEHPAAARALELPLFTKAEGADLLAVCGLNDLRPRLEGYSKLLGGHPLALRIFAGACLEQPFDEPEKVSRDVRSAQGVEAMPDPNAPGLSPEESQKRRQRRQFYKLLRWFQQKLSPPKRRLLQLVALFRDPVRTDTLAALALGLDAMKADFAGCDAAHITGLLDQLNGQFLLQKETSQERRASLGTNEETDQSRAMLGAPTEDCVLWTAHPIVRDVFREDALKAGDTVAKEFAEIVAGKGDGKRPKTVAEVLPIVEAIEVLLAAGEFEAAGELYFERLGRDVFLGIPAPQEGLRGARAFLMPDERRVALERNQGHEAVAFLLNAVALFSKMLGEMEIAERGYQEVIGFYKDDKQWEGVSIGLQNVAEIQTCSGRFQAAVATANEALSYARKAAPVDSDLWEAVGTPFPGHNLEEDVKSRCCRANTLSLAGNLTEASRGFTEADELLRQSYIVNVPLHAGHGVNWSRHRFRLGETETAQRLTEANCAICETEVWNNAVACCTLLLGELDLYAGNHAAAVLRVSAGLRVFREAGLGQDLSDALLAMARVRRAVQLAQKHSRAAARPAESSSAFTGDESALSYCEESLRLAARSGFELKKCDALNFRALLLRESGQPEKALADAKEAHDIAQRCDYYWGIHEALRQLRDTAKALNRTAEFREWDKAERDLTEKMKPEIAEALEINRQHDAEMEKLYGKKKK